MSDLTILYYTANRISVHFGGAVRRSLARSTSVPIVVVSQRESPHRELEISADFANRIQSWQHIDADPSIYQCYRNILVGAKAATTPFVACCEDDSLYVPEHFTYRPALDTFAYNRHRWVISRRLADDGKSREAFFYFRERTQMAMCIAPRELLIETLEERFAKYPQPVPHDVAKRTGWGEPGRYEKNLGLTPRKLEFFRSSQPCLTFNHGESLMGRRQVQETDLVRSELPPWGNATALWDQVHG